MAQEWVQRGNLKGDEGPQGPSGADGTDGTNGTDGRGVQSTDINTGGHLILTYTDSVQVDLGDVTGEDGTSVEIAGQVATYGDLPTGLTEADAGQGWLVDADGLLYVWGGAAFPVDGGGVEFRGPQGAQGTQGPAGQRGATWTASTSDPSTIPGGALVGDLWINSTTGDFFQIIDDGT